MGQKSRAFRTAPFGHPSPTKHDFAEIHFTLHLHPNPPVQRATQLRFKTIWKGDGGRWQWVRRTMGRVRLSESPMWSKPPLNEETKWVVPGRTQGAQNRENSALRSSPGLLGYTQGLLQLPLFCSTQWPELPTRRPAPCSSLNRWSCFPGSPLPTQTPDSTGVSGAAKP